MNYRKYVGAVIVVMSLLVLAPFAGAVNACDSFGQDWQITLGVFGGTFPATQLVTGCRDCDNSLGCGGSLALDGALVSNPSLSARIFSTTAYSPVGSSCFSTHWTGNLVGTTITGNVSNNEGPFGAFTITVGNCASAAKTASDPAHDARTGWELPK
jgi:hypothetical protein